MTNNGKVKVTQYDILLAEDNPDDALLMELALKESDILGNLVIAKNGKIAIKLLKDLIDNERKLPDLIFLDVNLPLINGLDVLKEIKENKSMSEIPIIVFTSSDSTQDMNYSYEQGAELYIRKPNNINEYKIIMQQIKEHFF